MADFSLTDFRQRTRSVLGGYEFKSLRPGENDKGFRFSGPGVVLICKEKRPKVSDDIVFKVLMVESAGTDALAVAKSLLAQLSRSDDAYLFAQLARIDDKTERDEATVVLRDACI